LTTIGIRTHHGAVQEVTMNNTRSLFTLITAATAVAALAAGLLMALNAPAPGVDDFGKTVIVTASSEDA
jgi:hypothetical protein